MKSGELHLELSASVLLRRAPRYTWIERDNFHILGQITKVLLSSHNEEAKALPPKPKSMQVRQAVAS
jgi:hypothetical protein